MGEDEHVAVPEQDTDVDVASIPGARGSPDTNAGMHVYFVGNEFGFPIGNASTNKLGLEARCLVEEGFRVSVLLLAPVERPESACNTRTRGSWYGADYEYTCGATTRSASFLVRRWRRFRGFTVAAWRLFGPGRIPRNRRCVILFSTGGAVALGIQLLCRLCGVSNAIDVCEWVPDLSSPPGLAVWSYRSGFTFRLANGIIAISRFLEERVCERDARASRKMLRLATLIDQEEFIWVRPVCEVGPYVLWAGLLPAYLDSVLFLIRALAELGAEHSMCRLMIAGAVPELSRCRLVEEAIACGVDPSRLLFPGYVSRKDLLALYRGARGLLLPLDASDRSKARLPFKLGEYLSAGRPVISSDVGDIGLYLQHMHNVLFSPPGDAAAFGRSIAYVLTHPDEADRIGASGREAVGQWFAYGSHRQRIAEFVRKLVLHSI